MPLFETDTTAALQLGRQPGRVCALATGCEPCVF